MRSRISVNRRSSRPLVLAALLASAPVHGYDLKADREVSSHKPVNISALELLFDRNLGLTLFKGDVKAVHGKVILTSEELKALSGNREATAEGKVQVVDPSTGVTMTCGHLDYFDLMDLMTAHEKPILTSLDENGRPITVEGRQMEMDSVKKTVVIHQNVRIYHDDGTAEAQKATFLSAEDKFIMEEDPKMTLPNGQLTGRRIVSNLGAGRSVLVEGMADALFYPSGKPPLPQATQVQGRGGQGSGPGAPFRSGPVGQAPTTPQGAGAVPNKDLGPAGLPKQGSPERAPIGPFHYQAGSAGNLAAPTATPSAP